MSDLVAWITCVVMVVLYVIFVMIVLKPERKRPTVKPNDKRHRRPLNTFETVEDKVNECLHRLNNEIEYFREDYEMEGNSLPNQLSINLFTDFLNEYFLIRSDEFRISPTVEGGVFIRFDNTGTGKRLYSEIYNDGEIVYISDFKSIGDFSSAMVGNGQQCHGISYNY